MPINILTTNYSCFLTEDLLQLAEETQMTNIWVGGKAGTCLEGELRIYTYHHHQCISAKVSQEQKYVK